MKDAQPRTTRLKNYRPPEFLIGSTELHFDLFEEYANVKATLVLRPNANAAGDTLVLHGEHLVLTGLWLNGRKLTDEEYYCDAESLTIPNLPNLLQDAATPTSPFTLECHTRIEPHNNTALEGLYKSGKMFCTQCEAEGFRRITYYLDRPDVMSRFTTTVCAEQARYPVLLSNGNRIADGTNADNPIRHWVTWQDPFPKPSYLFALVAGNLVSLDDSFTTRSGREVSLHIFVEAKDLDKCQHAMTSLKKAMRWDEEVYGREYDLNTFMIVAVDDFNMGAMENKGLNIFNTSCVLANPKTTTDFAFQRVEGVVAHEYFHNWSGNRVTCRDWFQLSLKEGFTVFRDSEFSADMNSRTVKRVEDVAFLKTIQFAEDAGPMAHSVQPDSYMEISNFYTVTVYEKGAEVVRMISLILGPEKFRQGCDLYFARHDGQAVTVEEFVTAMEEAADISLQQFRIWYSQAGTPVLNITADYNSEAKQYTLNVKQSCPATPGQDKKQPLHIPLRVGLLNRDGNEMPLHLHNAIENKTGETNSNADMQDDSANAASHNAVTINDSATEQTDLVLNLTEQNQQFIFNDVETEPVPSLLRGFSAPVRLSFAYPPEDLCFLMVHDSDGFNRWNAAQELALLELGTVQQTLTTGDGKPQISKLILEAYRGVIDSVLQSTDKAAISQLLTLPSESYLIEQATEVNVEAIHQAREFVLDELAANFTTGFAAIYEQNQSTEKYNTAAPAVAQRTLKNLALAFLVRSGQGDWLAACQNQFQQADNMTDQQAALRMLVNSREAAARPLAQAALAAFYKQWQHEPLVVDQWFLIQACCPLAEGLQRVMTLLKHPDFTLRNPNKVRALIGSFCGQNHINFHTADGAGYTFLADQVLALDALNPQIAARLLTPLTRWRKYDSKRQALMQTQLQRIKAVAGLSKDVFEVVSKSTM
ncbi:MAG: aminopeptidase N [Pseudohongiellaceae bacterium]